MMNGGAEMAVLPRQTEEMRNSWQGKALAYTNGKMAAVVLSMIAHALGCPIALKTLLMFVFPGYIAINPPFFCSAARISHTGRVTAHMVDRDGEKQFNRVVFESEADMEKAFRVLADELNLPDSERVALFAAVRQWIVADLRQNPITGEKDVAAW